MVLAGLLFGAVILTYRSGSVAEPRRRRVLTEAQAVGYRAAFGERPESMARREDDLD